MTHRQVFGQVFTVESAIAGAVFVAVLGLLLYSVVRRRAAAGATPSQRAELPGPEKFYVGVLIAVAAFLVAWTAWQNHRETHEHAAGAPVVVDVTAYQWCWAFTYPGDGGGSPSAPPPTTPPTAPQSPCLAGHYPTLVVPTGRTVRVRITSADVIHSLWVPELRYKMDAFPHHVNTFTLTVDRQGRWIGRCAEFCGERHYAMHFWFKAVSPRQYAAWAHSHSGTGQAGASA